MKFRKKPVVIEAWQIPPDNGGPHHAPVWVTDAVAHDLLTAIPGGGIDVQTLEGNMRGNVGDWIIKGVKDELYPCKPDIFEATYELVNGPAQEPRL